MGAAVSAQRGRGEEEKDCPRDTPGRGLYAPAAGLPDAPYVAPDASGDHRTKHTESSADDPITRRWPPDAGLSVRCPRACLAEHRTHLTGHCRDTIPTSGKCCPADSPHRMLGSSVRCSVRCTSGLFFNLEVCPTFTQPSSNF